MFAALLLHYRLLILKRIYKSVILLFLVISRFPFYSMVASTKLCHYIQSHRPTLFFRFQVFSMFKIRGVLDPSLILLPKPSSSVPGMVILPSQDFTRTMGVRRNSLGGEKFLGEQSFKLLALGLRGCRKTVFILF